MLSPRAKAPVGDMLESMRGWAAGRGYLVLGSVWGRSHPGSNV
jgi:hypothetical protein